MDIVKELSCDGIPPAGPVSAWPQERHQALIQANSVVRPAADVAPEHATKVKASLGRMVTGLAKGAAQVVTHGRVSSEIREERYETCKNCPFFVEDSKRCSECGCFMEAKTWIGGDPTTLCPRKKWGR